MLQTVCEATAIVLSEIESAAGAVNPEDVEALGRAVAAADGVFITGEGRSGLVAKCLAMRLMHLGLRAHVVGEAVTPAFGSRSLLIAVSGSGETPLTRTVAEAALSSGGAVAAVTAAPVSSLARSAGISVVIPIRKSAQFGGSLFEQAALVVFDSLALVLQHRLGRSDDEMRSRHATLE